MSFVGSGRNSMLPQLSSNLIRYRETTDNEFNGCSTSDVFNLWACSFRFSDFYDCYAVDYASRPSHAASHRPLFRDLAGVLFSILYDRAVVDWHSRLG